MKKTILGLLMLLVLVALGCASERYSESSYQDKQVLKEYIQNHPDYYQKWREEEP
jgi:ABC-type oligopeptide transport system substrate-binding subunit